MCHVGVMVSELIIISKACWTGFRRDNYNENIKDPQYWSFMRDIPRWPTTKNAAIDHKQSLRLTPFLTTLKNTY